jgi:isocitrate lyase
MGVPGIIVARTDAEAASLAISPEVILVRTAGSRFWVSKREISCCGRQFVTSMWSAHTLLLVAAIGALLVCVGLLGWLVFFRKSKPHTPFGL